MKQSITLALILLGALWLSATSAFAGTDEYMGDANIYAGVPTTISRPNVLIIIDNSRATEHTAAGYAYNPATTYAQKLGCNGAEDARNGCYLPWNIYEQDNQGDFATRVMVNSTSALTTLTCDPSTDSSKPIHTVFQTYGSYSGSGIDPFPNLKSDGTCDWRNNNSSGKVYALGNYLNYTQNGEGDDRIGAPDPSDGVVVEPEPVEECRGDIVSITTTQTVCTRWHPSKPGVCQTESTVQTTGYFECITDHTSTDDNSPLDENNPGYPWQYLGNTAPSGASVSVWASGRSYSDGDCNASEEDGGEEGDTPTGSNDTQRKIIYDALKQVTAVTAGVVNFGALSYGDNNSGGKLLFHMADLSANVADSDISETVTGNKVFAPDCSSTANANLPLCQFLSAIPGPGPNDGEPVLSSNTIRPQAESLLDAGYYYGAQYTPVTIGSRIPDASKNVCGLNHVILITNGFSNGDGSPRLSVVGDADGDNYANEEVYGLGSHWLDDVAKYLKVNYGIKTHTVLAFQSADELVMNAAKDGEGQFYNVFNANELSAALLKLLSNIINEASTSFVAPVVPASTTNRTISSNNVYLGLFRPQGEGAPWHGNIKKYKLSLSTLQLLGADGTAATDIYGNFDDDSVSYWSLASNNQIPTSTTEDGYINPAGTNPNEPHGDGGEVSAGGAGGVLLEKMRTLTAAIKADGSTWYPSGVEWRKIYTYLDGSNSAVTTPMKNLYDSQNLFRPDNSYLTSTNLNLRDNSGNLLPAARRDNLIRFLHGFADDESQTLPMTPATVELRDWVLGDILHSKPVVFNYTKYTSANENSCYDFANPGAPYNSSIIFAGANDGMLHAFRDCDGQELWAFLPPNALPSLQYVKDPQSGHATFVDAAPSVFVYDMDNDGAIETGDGDKVVLVFGQRRGGGTNTLDASSSRGAYYALDVSNPLQPKLLWEVDNSNLAELGETWSQPRLAKIPVGLNSFKVVAFVGAGYDNNEDLRFGDTQTFADADGVNLNLAGPGGTVDGSGAPETSSGALAADDRFAPRGRGILAIDVATLTRTDSTASYTAVVSPDAAGSTAGQIFWSYTFSNNNNLKYSIPSDLTVLDLNGDGYSDTIYTGDTGGNLWRFNVSGADKNAWSATKLFAANPDANATNGRKIFYKPEIAYIGAPHIYFGTGDREHPLNMSVTDRMYCVIDWGAQGSYPVTESSLVDATLNLLQATDTTKSEADAYLAKLLSSPTAPYTEDGLDKFTYGWFVKLDGVDRTGDEDVTDPGEKVLAPATVFNGDVFFSTYQIKTGDRAGCEAGNLGISRLYQMDYRTAEAVMNFDTSNDLTSDQVYGDEGQPLINERAIGGENGEVLQRTDRVRTLGEGIPSGIVTLIDASGRVTQLISSSDKVEAIASPDAKLITPVYWMQW